MKELKLKIEGMSCDMCVNTIKRLLSELDGIIDVDINLEEGIGVLQTWSNINSYRHLTNFY
ncbi:heavy-metal-associated domain-containing protein [Methanotorris formicicus]|uniref:Heavy metal transport/detoxification protein n=1 Tax=Methanotorris formicicus Mc-S-70 TaxID=647171 RepID=H1L184_9EURY|nr:heavy-metal-associated domain-containing protein [Methanotorris formicicus]EHP83984.1 Heavy metal transport/detoxification protein [Methanotorris formicicus Mc-S-70]